MAKQQETQLQKRMVEAINAGIYGKCRVSRIKNTGTYDPSIGRFRSSSTEKGIPDIIGCRWDGRAIFIEVKYRPSKNAKYFTVSPEQQAYLQEMEKLGAIVGIALSLADVCCIIKDDPINYPRSAPTYYYKTKEERKALGYTKRQKQTEVESGNQG